MDTTVIKSFFLLSTSKGHENDSKQRISIKLNENITSIHHTTHHEAYHSSIIKHIIHPAYKLSVHQNDIALIIVSHQSS